MSSLQPIVLHSHLSMLLEDLNVPYTTKMHTTAEMQQPDFLAINRIAKSPTIENPNTGLVLSESGAIMDYVVDQYDTTNLISFPTLKEKYLMRQWLQYQTTTHGPVLQRVFYFTWANPNPSARAAAVQDMYRVWKVLDDELTGKEWLVGDKCSAADLSYVAFQWSIEPIMGEDSPDMQTAYPHVYAWYQRMVERPSVMKVLEDRVAVLRALAPIALPKAYQ